MSKTTLEEPEKKYPHTYQDEYNDDDFNENYDIESEKNKIVEKSPKGRFIRFNEELGSGAYKTVYKAYDNETGWEVAWNVIKLQRLPDKERKRISDEIALLKQLKHPNIIHFINAWINRQKEEVIFITEAVTGGSLKRFLKKIKVPRLKVIKTWCREILQGIEYLHNTEPHPIIHRDIKCDNIFINSNKGEIRIGDLGLATFMSHAYADSVLGTPEFMAPEMYEEVYGPSVDIYSFGMCVLEMVTNQTPYRECMNPAQIYKKVSKGIKPSALNLIANEEVKNFIIECLKPKDERPTATELLKHKFLSTVDPELDNQPVLLFESPPMPKIDEEEIKESMKMNEKVQNLYKQAVEAEESESERALEDEKHSVYTEERKEEIVNKNALIDDNLPYELRKKAASEKTTFEPHTEKTNGSSHFKKIHTQKSQEILETKSATMLKKTEARDNIKVENQQDLQEKKEENERLVQKPHEDQEQNAESKVRSEEKKKTGSPKEIHEGEKPKAEFQDKQLRKTAEVPKFLDEERKAFEHKRYSEEQTLSHITESKLKEFNRYHFYSRGLINNFLTIVIKYEVPNSQYDSIMEIPKEKIYADKIKRKLLKHLDLTNPHDPYFNQQLNLLFETLSGQNILQVQLSNNLLHSYSAKSINEAQKSPDKSLLTTNPNSVYFMPTYFSKFYQKYLSKIPKEYLMIESEEAMNLRHQREIMELENFHLAQKRNMWDRRQNIMSNSMGGFNQNSFQPNLNEADDFYHKIFHFNEVSSRSEYKKKESRGTDLSLSSVDSVTLSPTCSSGNNIHSISNWTDGNAPCSKKEEALTNMIDDTVKLPIQTTDITSEHEKTVTDTTPKGQLNSQPVIGTVNSSMTTMSPKANTPSLSAKHPVSNFAIHAIKSTAMKTQSDKSGNKEKKPEGTQEKESESIPLKRPSIEKNLESGQQLTQAMLQVQGGQISGQTSLQNLQGNSGPQNQQSELDKVNNEALENKKEVKYEKLSINTNLSSSPPEKGGQNVQNVYEIPQQKSQQKTSNINLAQQAFVNGKKPHQNALHLSTSNQTISSISISTPTNKQGDNHPSSCRSNTSSNQSAPTFNQGFPAQPNSATLKNTQPLSTQQLNSGGDNANKPAINQPAGTNPIAQKLSIASYNSAGSLQSKTANTFNSLKNIKNPAQTQSEQIKSTGSMMKSNEISQSTYMKLQSLELLEKIKKYKIKGTLRRNDLSVDTEDVKMLQTCLELLIENEILSNGHFNHYTENLIKSCQERIGLPADGVVDELVWEKMQFALEKKIEKRKQAKEAIKNKEINEAKKDVDDIRKKMKDKQNKEASECLTKIESNLINLSDLK